MKNLLKWSSYLLAAALMFNVACGDDDPAPVDDTPDVAGEWVLAMATLVDGNAQTGDADALTIANYPASPIAVGDVQNTSAIVGGVLAGGACDDPVNNGAGFYIELTEDNSLNLHCPLEQAVSSEGSWNIIKNNDDSYTLALTVSIDGNELTILVNDVEVAADGSSMGGRATGFPVPADIAAPVSLTNIQLIVTDISLSAK